MSDAIRVARPFEDMTVADAVLADDAEFVTDGCSKSPATTLAEFADD